MTKKGFSLLEILIATLVLTIGVIAVSRAIFGAGVFASTDIEDVDLALNIAQANMEVLQNTAFGSLADSGPTADPNFSDFTVTIDVAAGDDPMQVEVTVQWNVKGGTSSVVLTTLRTDY